MRNIVIKNIQVHNLRGVNLKINPCQLIVFTGPSGSGKSSLAFDTLYIEGQRSYLESLSLYARKRLQNFPKPNIGASEGLTPTISIEQKTVSKSPRSTVGTLTEIYDYLRLLYARVGMSYCPVSKEPVVKQSKEEIIHQIKQLEKGEKIWLLAPYARHKKGAFKQDFQELLRKGFTKVRVDGRIHSLDEKLNLDQLIPHDIDLVIDRFTFTEETLGRMEEAVTKALEEGSGLFSILKGDKEQEILYSTQAYSQKSGLSYPALEPQNFSFNSPEGMCKECHGIGTMRLFNLEKIINKDKSIADDCCSIASSYKTIRYKNIYDNLADIYGFSVNTAWKTLSRKAQRIFLYGNQEEKKWTRMHFVHPDKNMEWFDYVSWKGVLFEAHKRYQEARSKSYIKKMEALMEIGTCPTCQGTRLQAYPAETKINNKKIHEITSLTIDEALTFFNKLSLSKEKRHIADQILKEIKERLHFMLYVGLDYLTLNRTAPTLSGGEAQRVRLASQIGSGLTGITYVLDEPSIGLHPQDNSRLVETLKTLRDRGNTVIVVEHDEETILAADEVIDFGPGAGHKGGKIVFQGTTQQLLKDKNSLTGAYLSGRKRLEVPSSRRTSNEYLTIKGAKHHNLKNITLKIPLGVFVTVTGVSGSGKSSLILETLYPALENKLHHSEKIVGAHTAIEGIEFIDKVIGIDQSPIGRTPRSNPATYIKLFDAIRDLFASLKSAQAKGFDKGRFSFNVKQGSCLNCQGMGLEKIDMDFMEDQFILCKECSGKRFDEETLSIYFKGKNIHDVLSMEVKEAQELFKHLPDISKKLKTLSDVGLDYMQLGQFSTTLSGGEAQRIKLAKELTRPSTGHTLYILDEPTTGLHLHDIAALMRVLQELVDRGNSVVIIEHHMDVVKLSDYVIDIGPEGGAKGGEIVAEGTPEEIIKFNTKTALALKQALFPDYKARAQVTKTGLKKTLEQKHLTVQNAHQHNLKHINVQLPREAITICTGPSGSGKSSFALETLYAEGQRRYVESLSPYARQFVQKMDKPKVERIEGLSPAIAIEQQVHAGNPRSTLGTQSEIYDYLRLLYAHLGKAHCPETLEPIESISKEVILNKLISESLNQKAYILAPIALKRGADFEKKVDEFAKLGYVRLRINGTLFNLEDKALFSAYDEKQTNTVEIVVDRLVIKENGQERLLEALEKAASLGNDQLIVLLENEELFFNLSFSVLSTGKSYKRLTPHSFSFNNEEGMCPTCEGIGTLYGAHLEEKINLETTSCLELFSYFCHEAPRSFIKILTDLFISKKIDLFTPFNQLPQEQQKFILEGETQDKYTETKEPFSVRWIGLNPLLAKLGKSGERQLKRSLTPLLHELPCPECQGARLNALARHVTLNQLSIQQLCHMPLDDTYSFLEKLKIPKRLASLLQEPLEQAMKRMNFLLEVGLNYLSLDRAAPTLSGGETQRVRLARQLGAGLTGVLYVLDEPTIGLHPHDISRLNNCLNQLKNLGNTLVLVEHDPLTIEKADHIIDFGPAAGNLGGEIIAEGSYKEILKDKKSLTGAFLSHKKSFPNPPCRNINPDKLLKLKNLKKHNLKNLSFTLPLGCFTCLTGVSGSGKSTIFTQTLIPAITQGLGRKNHIKLKDELCGSLSGISHIDKLIVLDQNPIGLTIRSDVASYTDLLTHLRHFFALLPEARARGLLPKHFSPNHPKGMCTECRGIGFKKIDMHFLPPVTVKCPACKGAKLNSISLKVTYKGKNLGQWLETTATQAHIAFKDHPKMVKIFTTLDKVGVSYLKLGQKMASLSLGEAQRIKLSKELSKRSTGHTLYLLDEPTSGLHSSDVLLLVKLLQTLVDQGNTVIAIEHNVDFLRQADYMIDLGPGAGVHGGHIVFEGSTQQLIKNKNSLTGTYL